MSHAITANNKSKVSLFKKCDHCIGITPHIRTKTGKIICALCKDEITYLPDQNRAGGHSYAA